MENLNKIQLIKWRMEDGLDYWEACFLENNDGWETVEFRGDNLFVSPKIIIEWEKGGDEFKKLIIKNIIQDNSFLYNVENASDLTICPKCGEPMDGSTIGTDSDYFGSNKDVLGKLEALAYISLSKVYNNKGFYCYKVYWKIEKRTFSEQKHNCSETSPRYFFYDEEGNYKEGGVDKLFDCKIWSHGLSTGFCRSSAEDYNDIINAVADFSSGWQICCSDKSQRIGPFGFYIMGHVQYVSNIDLTSRLNERGDRIFPLNNWRRGGLIASPEDYSLYLWDHTEAIIKDTKIVGVWFKDWFLKQDFAMEAYRDICEVAKENGMVVHVVKGRRE